MIVHELLPIAVTPDITFVLLFNINVPTKVELLTSPQYDAIFPQIITLFCNVDKVFPVNA